MSAATTLIVRDPPPEQPTTVTPVIVYSTPSSSSSLAGVTIVGFRNSASGTVDASSFNAAQITAANYVRDHVHVNVDLNNPQEKALSDMMIEMIFSDITTALSKKTSTFTDALGNKYTGADLVTLIKNVDFNIYGASAAAAAQLNTPAGGYTTFATWADINSKATVSFDLGKLAANISTDLDMHGVSYAIAHELGHALPAGHQIAMQNWNAFKSAHTDLTGTALQEAFRNSAESKDSEAFANTFGHEITTFLGAPWLKNSDPGNGYWHGIM
jgi:hypothetical protein